MRLADVLSSPSLPPLRLAGAAATRDVGSVALVDRSAEIASQRADAIVILTRQASSDLTGFRLDVAVRVACDAGLAALVLVGAAEPPSTALRLAERGGLALLTLHPGAAPGALLLQLDRALHPDAETILARLGDVVVALDHHHEATALELAAAATIALGAPLESSSIASRLVADAVARREAHDRADGERSARAVARLLDLLLVGGPVPGVATTELARRLGVAVDGSHRVIRFACGTAEAADRLVSIVQGVVRGEPGWLVGSVDLDVVAVRTAGAVSPVEHATRVAELVIERVGAGEAPLGVRAGIGGAYGGPDGVRASGAEAGLVLRGAGDRAVVVYDATGIRRVLAEWSATGSGARTLADALAPLAALDPVRARTAIETLQVYLDERGSLVAAGRALHLHPNAVAYRLARIRERLGSDLADPDERLMLQLACRAWLARPTGTVPP